MRDENTMKRQSGIALFVCLMILLLLSLFGISAMRMMTSQNMIATSSQGADLAFDASETAINRAIYDAQLEADKETSELPPVVPGGEAKIYDMPSDAKGIAKVTVGISAPVDMDDSARARRLDVITNAGAYGSAIDPHMYRFSATSTVEALGI